MRFDSIYPTFVSRSSPRDWRIGGRESSPRDDSDASAVTPGPRSTSILLAAHRATGAIACCTYVRGLRSSGDLVGGRERVSHQTLRFQLALSVHRYLRPCWHVLLGLIARDGSGTSIVPCAQYPVDNPRVLAGYTALPGLGPGLAWPWTCFGNRSHSERRMLSSRRRSERSGGHRIDAVGRQTARHLQTVILIGVDALS